MTPSFPRNGVSGLAGAVQVASFLGWILVSVGVLFTIQSVGGIVTNLSGNEVAGVSRSIAVPVWLSIASAPFIYVLGVYSVYQQLGIRLDHGGRAPWRVRLGLTSALGLHLEDVATMDLFTLRGAVDQGTFRAGRAAVSRFRARRAADLAARRAASQRLVDNAGLNGIDGDGRRLDRREFKETKAALEWLAVCMFGHYRNRKRFRNDIMEIVQDFERQGLRGSHGIELRVGAKGQWWYAYRETATGWVFGIGAAGKPENSWWYDGAVRPSEGRPTKPEWSGVSDETRLEWREELPTLED